MAFTRKLYKEKNVNIGRHKNKISAVYKAIKVRVTEAERQRFNDSLRTASVLPSGDRTRCLPGSFSEYVILDSNCLAC